MTKRRSIVGMGLVVFLLTCIVLVLVSTGWDLRLLRQDLQGIESAIRATTLPASPGLFSDE